MHLKSNQGHQENLRKPGLKPQKQLSQNIPTFYQNMAQLYQLKEQLIHMQHIFSPDMVNYHQMKIIEKLKTQINSSVHKMNQNRKENSSQIEEYQAKIDELSKEKEQLLTINQELVKGNTKLAEKLENLAEMKKHTQEHALELQKTKNLEIQKFKKQIDNIKLMHAQELYILRKKNKKN